MTGRVKRLSASEQLALRKRAKTELERLQALRDNSTVAAEIDEFKSKFTICEIVYKVILEDHQFNKTGKHRDFLKIDMTQAPHALKYAGYDFDKSLLNNLFGSCEKIGSRSVKKLRDSLTHSLNQKAIDELHQRHSELHGYMDTFLNIIGNFDR